MHSIDRYINDIEPRISAIIKSIPEQEEPSLQSSLASYGWILLDSWIAWRTMRFLLKDTKIDDGNQDKWIQTPSSYTSSQLRAAWKLSDSTIEYLKSTTNKSFQEMIDNTVQKKRNSSAHFNRKSQITGTDFQEIKLIFEQLSIVFRAYEIDSFIQAVINYLSPLGYQSFETSVDDLRLTNNGRVIDDINRFAMASHININCCDKCNKQFLFSASKDGCQAKSSDANEWNDVINDEVSSYMLLGNKGYYLNVSLFCETLEKCWHE